MKRLPVGVAVLGLVMAAGPVAAEEHEPPSFERHPHMLVHGLEVEETPEVIRVLGLKRCVDLAGNRTVPLHAHHQQLHFGTSGVSFGGASGHVVLPAAPFPAPFEDPLPWGGCADFEALIPFEIPNEG